MENENTESGGIEMLPQDAELKKEATGLFIRKADLLGESIVMEITGIGKNQYGKYCLTGVVNGDNRTLQISKSNYNDLITIFGPKISDWKKVKVTGEEFLGDAEKGIDPGVSLKVEKA